MDFPLDKDFVNRFGAFIAVASVLSGLASGLFANYVKRRQNILKRADLRVEFANEKYALANAAISEIEISLAPAEERLQEVRDALARQESIARANRWVSRCLIFGQYIIGGLLASSFVQESISPHVVGALGLLVLISSLIYQHFRPDIQLRGAMGRILHLRTLIRQAEDDLYAMRNGSLKVQNIEEFRRRISASLSEIEASEYKDATTLLGEGKHGKGK